MMKKTLYAKVLKIPQKDGYYMSFPKMQKTYLCDMKNANACQKRSAWYGYETIGPRTYALYRCATHGIYKVRLEN